MDFWAEENFPKYPELDTLQSNINNLTKNDFDPESFSGLLGNYVLNLVHERFKYYLNKFRHNSGIMFSFWMSYVALTSQIGYQLQEKKIELFIWVQSVIFIQCCFEYNRGNCAKYLPCHLLLINLASLLIS